jgi:hypothetical protein
MRSYNYSYHPNGDGPLVAINLEMANVGDLVEKNFMFQSFNVSFTVCFTRAVHTGESELNLRANRRNRSGCEVPDLTVIRTPRFTSEGQRGLKQERIGSRITLVREKFARAGTCRTSSLNCVSTIGFWTVNTNSRRLGLSRPLSASRDERPYW